MSLVTLGILLGVLIFIFTAFLILGLAFLFFLALRVYRTIMGWKK